MLIQLIGSDTQSLAFQTISSKLHSLVRKHYDPKTKIKIALMECFGPPDDGNERLSIQIFSEDNGAHPFPGERQFLKESLAILGGVSFDRSFFTFQRGRISIVDVPVAVVPREAIIIQFPGPK